jgi:4-amino-4-deoxy-L-arabinose transferase-like glycosyltransferase
VKNGSRAIVPAAVVILLVCDAMRDHFFRDEFYYLACSRRLAWGYVDQPPLSIAVLWLVRHLLGESLLVIRLVSALAFAGVLLLAASMARRLGGGSLAELLAMIGVAIAPQFLAVGGYYSMNAIDLLLWTAAIRVFIELLDAPSMARWSWLGVLLGLGLLNKISVLWLGGGLAAAVLLTRARRQLLPP